MGQRAVPRRVVVRDIMISRYHEDGRPVNWSQRAPGTEKIRTIDGEEVTLRSAGGQSSPAPGWELLLTEEHPGGGYLWTLYGIKPGSERNSRLI